MAYSIWLLKNSPKAFICFLAVFALTTVTRALSFVFSFSFEKSITDVITSESLPTPDGSIMILSGLNLSITSLKFFAKSPTKVQHIHPEFISVISIPVSFRNPPSIPTSPNSFSISTTFSLLSDSSKSFFISVVFPAPRKPETISILVTLFVLSYF